MLDLMKKKAAEPTVAVLIRVDKELHDEIKREAEREGRTVAGYIRYLVSTDPRRSKPKK